MGVVIVKWSLGGVTVKRREREKTPSAVLEYVDGGSDAKLLGVFRAHQTYKMRKKICEEGNSHVEIAGRTLYMYMSSQKAIQGDTSGW